MYYNMNYTIIFIQLRNDTETGTQFIADSLPHADVQLVSLYYIFKLQIYVTMM